MLNAWLLLAENLAIAGSLFLVGLRTGIYLKGKDTVKYQVGYKVEGDRPGWFLNWRGNWEETTFEKADVLPLYTDNFLRELALDWVVKPKTLYLVDAEGKTTRKDVFKFKS